MSPQTCLLFFVMCLATGSTDTRKGPTIAPRCSNNPYNVDENVVMPSKFRYNDAHCKYSANGQSGRLLLLGSRFSEQSGEMTIDLGRVVTFTSLRGIILRLYYLKSQSMLNHSYQYPMMLPSNPHHHLRCLYDIS